MLSPNFVPIRQRNKIQFYQTVTVVEVRVGKDESSSSTLEALDFLQVFN